jgi:glycosyltransferase involved in cell wall biosynthesis
VAAVNSFGQAFVVDDASHDQTALLAESAGALVVRHTKNRGYDAALNSGFAAAAQHGCRIAITFDADGQHDHRQLATVVSLLENGDCLVIGVRPRPARLAEWLFALYTRLRFGLHDPLCGLKGYSLELYKELGHFDSYSSIGTELMLYSLHNGYAYSTLPISIGPRHGESRFTNGLRANIRILRAMLLGLVRYP